MKYGRRPYGHDPPCSVCQIFPRGTFCDHCRLSGGALSGTYFEHRRLSDVPLVRIESSALHSLSPKHLETSCRLRRPLSEKCVPILLPCKIRLSNPLLHVKHRKPCRATANWKSVDPAILGWKRNRQDPSSPPESAKEDPTVSGLPLRRSCPPPFTTRCPGGFRRSPDPPRRASLPRGCRLPAGAGDSGPPGGRHCCPGG